MPSIFSFMNPVNAYQVWFTVYLYFLPFLLYAAWASLSIMDMGERVEATGRFGLAAFVLLVPIVGGAWYLIRTATTMRLSSRIAIVVTGLIVWLLPFVIGVWIAGGPLGPKALN